MRRDVIRFDRFSLDLADRSLSADGAPVELAGRAFDALALLVREAGRLVTKEAFLDQVWRGVPVTDEALTQTIRTLRRQLGDDAARPRFIETVPKHGYRFIAPLLGEDDIPAVTPPTAASPATSDFWLVGGAGTLGGTAAGLVGGILYGFVAAMPSGGPGVGLSLLLVLAAVSAVVGTVGGAGVAFGIAAAGLLSHHRWRWSIAGGAAGGLIVGAGVKLLGLDAFDLLLGRAPLGMAGAGEGLLLGAAVGLGAWLASRAAAGTARGITIAAVVGAIGGLAVALTGGRLMAGSLDLLATSFPASRLRLDHLGALSGEGGFGPIAHALTATLEGALFAGSIVGTMLLVTRRRT